MVKGYRRQLKRLEQLKSYWAIVTHSAYMRDEYIKHGFDPIRVRCLSYYAHQESSLVVKKPEDEVVVDSPMPLSESPSANRKSGLDGKSPASWRLLFLGRMDRLKGGQVLIDALPYVSDALGQTLHITFAGDGRMRKTWERHAARVQARTPGLKFSFAGWVKGNERDSLWNSCDLLVVPSVWPEPFGLVGPEAGLHGVPIAAFAVGGIPHWLTDGVNGCLAPDDPPTSEGLAEAILRCLSDPATYANLQRGAMVMARRFNMQNHLAGLVKIFEEALTL
jgi:glycosyltransferase involved in cell wall biosynthesis